jgi:hypothetical protein
VENYSSILASKSCAFLCRIDFPLTTMIRITQFFIDRRISVGSIQMHGLLGAEARLTIHCLIEKDRIRHVWYSLEKVPGILELELLESKGATAINA